MSVLCYRYNATSKQTLQNYEPLNKFTLNVLLQVRLQ